MLFKFIIVHWSQSKKQCINLKYVELAKEKGINIIALGKSALNALKQKKIEPDEIMRHPSHYKRFNGSKNHAIVEDLKGVLC